MGGWRRFVRRLSGTILGLLLAGVLFSPIVVRADTITVTLESDADVTAVIVLAAPAGTENWSDDLLGSKILFPGDEVDVNFDGFDPSSCLYDFKALTLDEDVIVRNVDLCSDPTVSFE
jgi:hypothetical protein